MFAVGIQNNMGRTTILIFDTFKQLDYNGF